jgi:hypothetical protein
MKIYVYDKKFPTDEVDDKRIMARIRAEQTQGNYTIRKSCIYDLNPPQKILGTDATIFKPIKFSKLVCYL